ncbi:hypothetical protein GZ78_14295 [Endozoicomonas numazuensis]|uniref:MalT-like TPR region domain-containing protein n=2 Tax=Endozoicomonas numazuensis TaxID=1137799 RepID=A0A081NF39_9GAMM|nr:hypothetical protein GZ78_14295 [Endozoicomonas numazuensis]
MQRTVSSQLQIARAKLHMGEYDDAELILREQRYQNNVNMHKEGCFTYAMEDYKRVELAYAKCLTQSKNKGKISEALKVLEKLRFIENQEHNCHYPERICNDINIELAISRALEALGDIESLQQAEENVRILRRRYNRDHKRACIDDCSGDLSIELALTCILSKFDGKSQEERAILFELYEQYRESELPALHLGNHFFLIACKEINSQNCYQASLDLALMYAELSVSKNKTASNLSSLAHIQRLLGDPVNAAKQWSEASKLRSHTTHLEMSESWRSVEHSALRKLEASQQ